MNAAACASTDILIADWHQINWEECYSKVKKLQARIVKAQQKGRYNKVKALQWLLTHSFSAKAIAVKRVTENKGKNTPGIDGVVWKSSSDKEQAISRLSIKGYKSKPLRRIYIPKKNSKKRRGLGIPVMKDRAMQALYLMALVPVAETICDGDYYGFRKERSTADAIEAAYKALCRRKSASWILEGDIKGCFDSISHEWLLQNIQMDKRVLKQWLKSGIIFGQKYSNTVSGTPEGGIISPCLAVLALNGLQTTLENKFKYKEKIKGKSISSKINIVFYADDFIVTGRNIETLKDRIIPEIEEFMEQRGLEMSKEKTIITHISKGFDFLGQNIRKYNDKLLIKPSKNNIKSFLKEMKEVIYSNLSLTQAELIRMLNPKITGWANYHRHAVSKETFGYVDYRIFEMLWKWCCRRHPKKSRRWIKNRYFHQSGNSSWVFEVPDGQQMVKLRKLSETKIVRYTKIRKDANPYSPEWYEYFEEREGYRLFYSMNGRNKLIRMWKKQGRKCPVCGEFITKESGWRTHKNTGTNTIIVHAKCHEAIHGKYRNLLDRLI